MARKPKDPSLCEFGGCKHRAAWTAHKLWGKGGTIRTCEEHKPGSKPRPASLAHLRDFYRLEPIP